MIAPTQENTLAALENPAVGDHWSEWHGWNAFVTSVSDGEVTIAVFNDEHPPQLATRTIEAYRSWLTYGGKAASPWAFCQARGIDVSALQTGRLPTRFSLRPVQCGRNQSTEDI